jgi:hypothetical protein
VTQAVGRLVGRDREMKGRVVEGYLEGSQVREAGQLVDPAISAFEGTIDVRPTGRAS